MAKLSSTPVKDKFKKLPNAAKSAPERIVRKTMEAAINSVEKAAEKEVFKTAKAAEKKALKAKKANEVATRASRLAKDAAARAMEANLNGADDKLKKKGGKPAAARLKSKIKRLLERTAKEKAFYYDRRCLVALAVLYGVLACLVFMVSKCLLYKGFCFGAFSFAVLAITQVLTLLAFGGAVLLMIFVPKAAVVNAESIKIDHNAALKWADVTEAEEKYTSFLFRRPIMVFHLKEGAKYKLKFMQKLCRHNVFTPFSLPLYAMRPEDVMRIRELVKDYAAKYRDTRN